jgi:hypothetical protein
MSLEMLINRLPAGENAFPRVLLEVLKRRFENGYKSMVPFNSLTFLDPRYMDIYFTPEETESAKDNIASDQIFGSEEQRNTAARPVPAAAPSANPFAARRSVKLSKHSNNLI